ncbi:peptidoglycan editing factor PgeF [Lachnospiraceae bacterium MD1]|uniref:Purine nucleoside phosphorylase n=1 Tax=Variimorphobacter saccharofermentans TaxID=2755051 RepID=A0A839K2T6_9FIRM|nr:peptidoglycan editing factor PgeF [Variimorphobacter saccharofermentans]MBB2183001.1 peptidoglycan editing factor PgeF [Variimorphobacter saccharofermentans]
MQFKSTKKAVIDYTVTIPHISFPALSEYPFIIHGFSTRFGGVSSGFFSTMNLGYDSGPIADNPNDVKENFRRIASSIGFDPKTIVISKQVHKTNVRYVDQNDCGKGLFRPRDFDEVDGFITNVPNVTLVTKYADCVPLYFVDPVKKAIGLSHSGWRGTVQKIGYVTVKEMQSKFGTDPKDIVSVIGPSICKNCFEIGEEVAEEFRKAFNNWEEERLLSTNENGKYQCDLWAANRLVLLEAGLTEEHIHISGVCTSCYSDLLFSHRKTGGKRGSLAAFLALKE